MQSWLTGFHYVGFKMYIFNIFYQIVPFFPDLAYKANHHFIVVFCCFRLMHISQLDTLWSNYCGCVGMDVRVWFVCVYWKLYVCVCVCEQFEI